MHPLVPYAGHFHLRQGANKQLQARWEDGEINVVEVVGRLQEVGYEGYLTLEYEHEPGWMDMDKCDVLTETIKMRDTVGPLCTDVNQLRRGRWSECPKKARIAVIGTGWWAT